MIDEKGKQLSDELGSSDAGRTSDKDCYRRYKAVVNFYRHMNGINGTKGRMYNIYGEDIGTFDLQQIKPPNRIIIRETVLAVVERLKAAAKKTRKAKAEPDGGLK